MTKEAPKTPAPKPTQPKQQPTAAQQNRQAICRFDTNLNAYMNLLCAVEIANRNAEKIGTLVSHDVKHHVNKMLNVQRQFKNFIFDGLTDYQKEAINTTIDRAIVKFNRIIAIDIETGEIKINTK